METTADWLHAGQFVKDRQELSQLVTDPDDLDPALHSTFLVLQVVKVRGANLASTSEDLWVLEVQLIDQLCHMTPPDQEQSHTARGNLRRCLTTMISLDPNVIYLCRALSNQGGRCWMSASAVGHDICSVKRSFDLSYSSVRSCWSRHMFLSLSWWIHMFPFVAFCFQFDGIPMTRRTYSAVQTIAPYDTQ